MMSTHVQTYKEQFPKCNFTSYSPPPPPPPGETDACFLYASYADTGLIDPIAIIPDSTDVS